MNPEKPSLYTVVKEVKLGFGPQAVREALHQGMKAVVFDVLRASATLTLLIEYQVKHEVVVFRDVRDAERFRDEHADRVVLVGERQGIQLPGFDFGNSPSELEQARDQWKDATIGFTSTTGGRTLVEGTAGTVFVGGLTNLFAIRDLCHAFLKEDIPFALIPAYGDFSSPWNWEDLYPYFYLAHFFEWPVERPWKENRFSHDVCERVRQMTIELSQEWDWSRYLIRTPHGKRLFKIGYGRDVAWINNRKGTSKAIPVIRPHKLNVPGERVVLGIYQNVEKENNE